MSDTTAAVVVPENAAQEAAAGANSATEGNDAPKVEVATEKPSEPDFQAITSQEQFDKLIGKRLGALEQKIRAEYQGFEDLKAKAKKFDEAEAEKLTDDQRRQQELDELKSALADREKQIESLTLDALRKDIAAEKGLPAKFAARLSGTSREELEADADDLLEVLPKPQKSPASNKPVESLKGGGKAGGEAELTADDIVKAVGPIRGITAS